MRILLVADIHANWPALEAITEPFDVCLCLGDLVDYGLEPAQCIDWVRRRARYAVRGNHDHGVVQNVAVAGRNGFKYLTGITRPLSRAFLNPTDRRFLATLPLTQNVTLADTRFLLVHATPRDPLDEYAPMDVAFWERRLQDVDADLVCVGHTHFPFILEVGNKLVINPGSVGLPRDGDPRASYAILEAGRVELKRIDYPIEAAVNTVHDSTLPDAGKELLIEVLRTGRVNGNGSATTQTQAMTKDEALGAMANAEARMTQEAPSSNAE